MANKGEEDATSQDLNLMVLWDPTKDNYCGLFSYNINMSPIQRDPSGLDKWQNIFWLRYWDDIEARGRQDTTQLKVSLEKFVYHKLYPISFELNV